MKVNDSDSSIRNNNQVEQAFTVEEWAPTPEWMQVFVLSLLHRLQTVESEVAALKEQVNPSSQNSSQPPSSDRVDQPEPKEPNGKGSRNPGVNLVIRSMSGR